MYLDDFCSSGEDEQDSDETVNSKSTNCRTEVLSDPESLDTPEYVSIWVSNDGLLAMMEVEPSYFRKNVSTEIKDRAKKKGLIHLNKLGERPTIVLIDDPEEYGALLEMFGLEDYLLKRVEGAI